MARGFESKDVEFQQAEAERRAAAARRRPPIEDRQAAEQRAALTLTLSRVRADLDAARSPAHRRMLEQSLAALEQQLTALTRTGSGD